MTTRCTLSKAILALLLWLASRISVSAQHADWLPNVGVVQYAGNIGFISAGAGWSYGMETRWQTELLLGYLPHFTFDDDSFTLTLRQQYLPWQYRVDEHWSVTPASFAFSLNAVMNNEFWVTEPINNNYYRFSSKVRMQLGLGSRINFYLPTKKERRDRRISLYYELSTYDLVLLSYVRTSHTLFSEILSLGIGVNVSLF